MRLLLVLSAALSLFVTSYLSTEETVTEKPKSVVFSVPSKVMLVKVIKHDTVKITKVVTKIKTVNPTTTTLYATPNKPTFLDDNIGKAARSDLAHASNNVNVLAHILNKPYCVKHKIPKDVISKNQKVVANYINEYKDDAIKQEKLNGIPACITLAQGILESGAGTSMLANRAHNHFGIKCFQKGCKTGHCINASDDTHKDFFLCFPTVENCYEAHSEFLKKPRYAKLFKIEKSDYKGWAKGLKECGYATAPNYAKSLVTLIEGLGLNKIH